jgi:hypothetical protein
MVFQEIVNEEMIGAVAVLVESDRAFPFNLKTMSSVMYPAAEYPATSLASHSCTT